MKQQEEYNCLASLGFGPDQIEQYLLLEKEENWCGLLQLLESRRHEIVSLVHVLQKQMDCLDYLINEARGKKQCRK